MTLLVMSAVTTALSGVARADGVPVQANPPIEKVADVPLGGGTTRLDYASLDSRRHLLFIAHLGDSEVIVFDVQASRVVGRVADVSSVHGVLVVPELNLVYATATGKSEVTAIDPATLTVIAHVPTGGYPDGLAYAPDAHKLYVSDEMGGNEAVIDVRTIKRVASIALGGEAGNTQYDLVINSGSERPFRASALLDTSGMKFGPSGIICVCSSEARRLCFRSRATARR